MELSVREAKARFSEAAEAAAAGTRVVVTKHGKPFIELVPVAQKTRPTFEEWEAKRVELGLTGGNADWFDEFISNPEASRRVLGLDD